MQQTFEYKSLSQAGIETPKGVKLMVGLIALLCLLNVVVLCIQINILARLNDL